ncbi:hypothetical protein K7X08_014636 [Anisodus acutangulus]|uniref:BHLH domain-containing protein n=1 Tax=Anisodus acutangulus TaxID=402998 RepID=A0A9Q1LIM3_9SOLA|nr:hypothetical protein K7X08_014636 [Anisodus acutangulus]
MADPYKTTNSLESEDMSSFFLNFLQGNSSSASATLATGFYHRSAPAPVAESSSSLNFSDPGRFYAAENVFASAGLGNCDGMNSADRREFLDDDKVDNFGFSSEECDGLDMPNNQNHPRSSKRSRSAEVHNLSEKRRRSRINEKLKALQNLIPNSNKTDKASMLDEAIEYLKQLQLQVQMLTLRNGLSLYPGYVPGSLQSMQPPSGNEFDGRSFMLSANGGATLPGNREMQQTAFEISNQNPSGKPTITSHNTENAIALETTTQNHYGLLNHLASSKDMCRDNTLSRLHFDMSCSGNNSSSGVSS